MRCNTLIFASFMPAVVFGSWGARAGNATVEPGNSTHHDHAPAPSSTGTPFHLHNSTRFFTNTTAPTPSSTGTPFLPHNNTGFFTNASAPANTTRRRKPCSSVYPTGYHPKSSSSLTTTSTVSVEDFSTLTITPSATTSGSAATITIVSSGHLPFTKGAEFTNSTTGFPEPTNAEHFLSTGFATGYATEFTRPTAPAISIPTAAPSSSSEPESKQSSTSTKPATKAAEATSLSSATPTTTAAGTGLPYSPSSAIPPFLNSTATYTTRLAHFPTSTPSSTLTFINSASLRVAVPTTLATIASSAPYQNGTSTISSTATPSSTSVALYYQCGGLNYVGSTTCVEGATCQVMNAYYSQCVSAQ